jgi:hypothetical protein
MYQESAVGYSVLLPTSSACLAQASCASCVGSMASIPCSRMCARQSAIQSTCCSIETIMLLSTEGLDGPVTVSRFGNPTMPSPR